MNQRHNLSDNRENDMSNSDKVILVSGATGQQGGATARHLLAKDFRVRALTRNAKSEKALVLAARGAEIVEGNLEDRAALDGALKGVYGVFSVQNFWLPGVGFEGEIKQGKLLADAASAAGVNHFVYSSVGAAQRGMGQKHFDSKWQIEQYIQSLGVPYTILRPVAFMDNYNWQRAAISNGTFAGFGLRPDKTIQLIAAEDIGEFAALVFENPPAYLGKTIELAGDEVTEPQIAELLTRVTGRTVQFTASRMPDGGTPTPEQIAMFNFFNGQGYDADIPALRKIYPGLHTLEQWLRQTGWENLPVLELPTQSSWG
jgi:uncharacterized protein YbjT (DUF2867 family)